MANPKFEIRNSKSGSSRGAGAGFTLLELLIVLFIVALILTISSVFIVNALTSGKLDSTAREMSAMIRHAKALSQINGERKVITIDLDSKSYGIEGRETKVIPREVGIKIIDPFAGEVDRGQYTMTFNAGGGIEGGTIVIWSNKRALSIELDPVIGAAIIK